MSTHGWIDNIALAVLIAAAVIKLTHLRRPGTNRAAVAAMCVCVIVLAGAAVVENPEITPSVEAALGVAPAYALRHTIGLVGYSALHVAFLCWVWPPGAQRRTRLRVHAAVLGALLLVRWAIGLVSADADAAAGLQARWQDAPWTTVAMVLYALYLAWTVLSIAYLAWIWAAEPSTRRWTRVGLRLIAAGMLVMGAYLAHKFGVLVFTVGFGGDLPYDQVATENVVLVAAAVVLCFGLALPLAATGVPAAVALARYRAAYGRITPLWAALTADPERQKLVLRFHPGWLPRPLIPLWDRISLSRMGFRLYHRVIECWDVAVKLHGHCDREVHERTYSTALAHGQEHYSALATAEAVVLHRALDRARRTREFLPEDRRIRPGEERTRTLAHNIEWWRRVGHAWNSPLTRFLVSRTA